MRVAIDGAGTSFRSGAHGAVDLASTSRPHAKPIGPLFDTGPGSDCYGSFDWG